MSTVPLIKESFAYLESHQDHLTEFQASFILSLRKYFKKHKSLTEKQSVILFEIVKYLNDDQKQQPNGSEQRVVSTNNELITNKMQDNEK